MYSPPMAKSCLEIYNAGEGSSDGIYTIAPPGFESGFEVWCKMSGTYPGATLAIRKGDLDSSNCGASVGNSNGANTRGCENESGSRHLPCREDYRGYCKLSDAQINAVKATSTSGDPYIVHSNKSYNKFFGVHSPDCWGFVAKTCTWRSDQWGGGCANAKTRDSTRCNPQQTNEHAYRGVDGHSCTNNGNYFMIFEHARQVLQNIFEDGAPDPHSR